jgi:PAS domain S-box-containing protein
VGWAMKRFGIRHYVVWLTLIPTLISAVGLEAYFLRDRSTALDKDLIARGELMARQLATSSEYGVFANNLRFLQDLADGMLRQPDVRGVLILNSGSQRLVGAGDLSFETGSGMAGSTLARPKYPDGPKMTPVTRIEEIVSQGHPILRGDRGLLIYEPIIPIQVELDSRQTKPAAKKIGAVIIELGLERTKQAKSQMLWVITATTGLFVILSFGLRHLASRRISRPVCELSDAVQRIGKGKLETRASASNYVTELSSLADGINAMAERLQQERANLHQQVDEATRLAAIGFESHEGMLVGDANTVIIRVNKAFSKITGYTDTEVIGQTPSLLKSDIHDANFFATMWENINNSGSWEGGIWNRRRDGELYYAWLTITVIKSESGKIANYVATYTDVTERQKLQMETAALLRRNQTLMKNAVDGIHILDIEGNVVEANDAFCRMLGYTKEEASRLNVSDWDRKWSAEELRERMKRLSQDGVSATFETKHCRRDGTLIDIEISCTGVEIDGQHYLFASSRDIGSRKQTEEMLRIAAATFETHEGIMITDANANIIRVNQAFQEITGYTADEVLGKNPRILGSGRHDAAFYQSMWNQLLETGAWTGEIWDKRKSGQIYPKLLTITAIRDDRQKITQYVAIFRDITERKKAEEDLLLKSGTEHRRAEELVQQLGYLLKNSFNEIYIFDADSLHFLLTSEGAEKNLGYTSGELKQFTPLELCPSIAKESFNRMLELLSSGKQQSVFLETALRRKNGSVYPVEARLQFINLDSPVFMFIVQDITEHKVAQRELRNLSAHLLTVREEEKASFAREIHDHLGGTLTALKMDINWLMDEMSVHGDASMFLSHIESMSSLLDEAANVTRRVITDLRPTILDDLGLRAALEWQGGQFQKRTGIDCSVTCTEDCQYQLDKVQTINLFRIFQEALTNVARHSGASSVDVTLRYATKVVILVISDNGRGMPDWHAIGPTSFGLLGMRERVEQMGGSIKFGSPPAGGFSVAIFLPLLKDSQKTDVI